MVLLDVKLLIFLGLTIESPLLPVKAAGRIYSRCRDYAYVTGCALEW